MSVEASKGRGWGPAARRTAGPVALLVLLGLAIHLLLPQITTLEHSLHIARRLVWWALLLAIATQALSYVGNGLVTRALVTLFGRRLSLLRCIGIVMGSYSIGLLWGGQFTQTGASVRWLRASGVSGEGALLSAVIPGFINVFTIVAVSIFGLIFLLARHELSRSLAIVFAIALALLVAVPAVIWWGMRQRSRLTGVLRMLGRAWARLRRRRYDPGTTDEAVTRLFDAWGLLFRGAWRAPILGDTLNVGFDILTLYLLFIAAHYTPSPELVLAGYGLPLLAGKMAVLPGGLGVVEGGMAGLYELLGVPSGVVVVVILGYRLISFWIPALLGFLLVPFLDGLVRAGVEAR